MPDSGRPTSTHAAQTHRPDGPAGRVDQYGIVPAHTREDSHRETIRRRNRHAGPGGPTTGPLREPRWFESRALYASSSTGGDAVAFIAERDSGSMPVELHANLSKGLLIVSSFRTRLLSDGPERRFAREFFRRADPESLGPLDVSPKESAVRPLSSSSAVSTFGGSWRNTNTIGSGIASVSFALTDDGGTLRVQGRNRSDANDWGTATVEIYNEIGALSEPAKIKASYDLGSMDVQLHGWVKQGVLVLAVFRRFKDCARRVELLRSGVLLPDRSPHFSSASSVESSMPDSGRPTSTHAARRIDPTALQGEWINTEASPRHSRGLSSRDDPTT